MLCEVHITNLALIESLTLSFGRGLSVLTGETGAGKSIILQAIHLLSGGKASPSWIRSGADSATIEALFEIDDHHADLAAILVASGFDTDTTLILKRIISAKGRSRYYVNNSLATAKLVGELAENLLSVASQHDHQQLLVSRNHLDFIDAVGDIWSRRQAFATLFDQWLESKAEYEELHGRERDKEQRKDFLGFQVREINEAAPLAEEDARLNMEKERLKAADDLLRLGRKSYTLLYEAVDPLAQVRKNLEQIAELDRSASPLAEEVAGLSFQLEDQLAALRDYVAGVPDEPLELESIMARLDILQQLKRKYGPELADVIEHGRRAAKELAELESLDERLDILREELARQEADLMEAAEDLSRLRRDTARTLQETIARELASLRLEQAAFEIHFAAREPVVSSLSRTGLDRPAFMFSANPGEPVKPIAQIASGGELSRLMLALKCLLARKDQVETVIFDEVDAGISGKAAEAVARKIRELASHHQVICITHLPQIASYADDHYQVQKSVANNRTQSSIIQLDAENKIRELARMLDGDSVTPQTLAYARELIQRNQ